MIPLRLHIKNFLSYGATVQTINFEPYHLICLSGKNGHGKSALLDAITWSLWGQARKATSAGRSEAHLLRLGSTNMVVALDFICNNHTYRVRREYNNDSGKNITYLDFGIYDEQGGQWRQLTTKTIRETQDVIISVIGLDAEAFENSAFLRQGHSDEFSRKSPKDRKEMLANILGIGMYEVLRKKSIERGREENLRYQNGLRTCDVLKQAIAPQPQVVQDLAVIDEQYVESAVIDQSLSDRAEVVRTTLQALYGERQSADQLLAIVLHVEYQIRNDTLALQTLWLQWRDVRKRHRLLSGKHISNNRREQVMFELSSLQKDLQKKVDLITHGAVLKEQAQAHVLERQKRHENELKILLQQDQLHAQQEKIIIHDEQRVNAAHREVTQVMRVLEAEEKTFTPCTDAIKYEELIAQAAQKYEHTQMRLQHGMALQSRVVRDLDRVTQEKVRLSDAHASVCVVCLQSVQPEQMARVCAFRDQQMQRYAGQKKRLKNVIVHYQERVKNEQLGFQDWREQYKSAVHVKAQHDAHHTRREHARQQWQVVEGQLAAINAARKLLHEEWVACQSAITVIRTRHTMEQRDDALLQDVERQLVACEEELRALSHIQERHTQLQKELAEIAEEELLRATIMQEVHLQEERAVHIRERCQHLRELKAQQKERLVAREAHARLQEQISALEQEDQSLQQERIKLAQNKERLASQKGALEQAIRHINQQKILLEQERKQVKISEDNAADYVLLGQVLSKDGIQGMLIEHVLPEIEHEANILLAKLTDNQAQLQFESLRGLKSGVLKETLDIKIADALGTRPYELFSGGEAFRIDFALRLAISKLLARRAGASVQTLIIDEGFGSQDEEGLHYIMESLYAIQHEFAKIIIVSHLPTMKDQFPTHFHIHKGMQGSTVHLIEQG